jgi:hypothetical protein
MSLPDISLTRNQRRVIRAIVALLSAVGMGTLNFPDFIPAAIAHNIQQADMWLVSAFLIINPILDLGADDAKNDTSK